MESAPDIISMIQSGISTAMIQVVVSMISPQIGFLTLATFMLTQFFKIPLTHFHKAPSADFIWWVLGPASGLLISGTIWTQEAPHWFAAGCAASLWANIGYAVVMKRVVRKFFPEAYNRANILKERRKRDTMTFQLPDRRRR